MGQTIVFRGLPSGGIEPGLALVKVKIVNNPVPQALIRLGYSPSRWRRP